MAYARSGEVSLWYEVHGEDGPPLLLIEGLGYASWMWFKQVPAFSRFYRTIVFDNRGVGRSDKPDVPYSIPMMADDAAAVLDAVGIDCAHVLGYSMGSFIAQEFALRHPDRLGGLVLGGTSPGGPDVVIPGPEVIRAMTPDPDLPAEENIRRGLSVAARPGYYDSHSDEREAIVRFRLAEPTPVYAHRRQSEAAARHDTSTRLGQIKAPTLVIVAEQDAVVPPANGFRVAQAIPGAKVAVIPESGHHAFIEKASLFNQIVLEFLHGLDQEEGRA